MGLGALVLILLVLVLINVPIAIALGAMAVLAMLDASGPSALPNVGLVMFTGTTRFPLIAIPLFILAGAIMNASGISRRLVALASALFGFIRGGLSMVTISASLFFAEISGSAVIIPPSIPMILYGVMSDSSIVELFVAGILPGVLGGLLMMFVAYVWARRNDLPVEAAFNLRRVRETFVEAGWALLLPVIILGGIFTGWVTATEGAGLAVLAALVIGGLVYRELDLAELKRAVLDGGTQTAVVMLLVATSALLGDYLTEVRVPQQIATAIMDMTSSPLAVLALLNVFFLLVGLFLHSAAAIILVVPIVMPLVHAVGIDPVHFGLIVTLNLGVGQQTPPVASVLVTACSVAKADIWDVTRANVSFVAVLLAVLLLVTYVPTFSLLFVEMFYR